MKVIVSLFLAAVAVAAAAQPSTPMTAGTMTAETATAGPAPGERLGTVSFSVSCAPPVQASFNRGVALLHDFWYAEARPQFQRIAAADPGCAMAHWGIAMSAFHQIWDRPGRHAMALGWEEIEKAQALHAKTAREREYISALAIMFKPGSQDYLTRAAAYSAAMGALYKKYPDDVDAGSFYALSLLASSAPDDTSLAHARQAMAVLEPLFARYPGHPGVDHYVIHSCDNPSMAKEALPAAMNYGQIAPSGPHAAHMPGHIFARLGMWPQDIDAQLASIRASETAEAHGESGIADEPHSYDFLMYAYLQSGQDANAEAVLSKVDAALKRVAKLPDMGGQHMRGMQGYYETKFPAFYALETRDWQSAAALAPVPGAEPEDEALTWWARAIADGHLRRAEQAKADLAQYDVLMAEVKKGPDAYMAGSTDTQIARGEIAAWAAYAAGEQDQALSHMRAAADLQDKVGQGEVDIPAREMLGDMLLGLHRPQPALAAYRVALQLSPNRFNGLYHAGLAAEESGDKSAAAGYYAALLKSAGNGPQSTRPELAHAKAFIASDGVWSTQAGTR